MLITQDGLEVKLWDTFKALLLFYDLCKYLTNDLIERIHIWTICTIQGRVIKLKGLKHLEPCPWVGLEVKIYDI